MSLQVRRQPPPGPRRSPPDCFVVAFPAETTEAFLEGHVRAFAYFGGVPTRILYDNTKIAVAKILGGAERQRTRAFSELESHYLFADKFGRPAKGNDKGKVEGLVGYARRNFMVPLPRVPSWEEWNTQLEAQCRRRRERRLRGHAETIGERFERDRAARCRFPSRPMRPAKRSRPESARWRWCAIAATTILCPPATGISACWCGAMFMR